MHYSNKTPRTFELPLGKNIVTLVEWNDSAINHQGNVIAHKTITGIDFKGREWIVFPEHEVLKTNDNQK